MSAGNASTATSFTIAFATFADVIVPIDFHLVCFVLEPTPGNAFPSPPPGPSSHASQCLTRHPRDLLAHLLQFFRVHARSNLVQIDSARIRDSLRPRPHSRSARNTRRQKFGILLHELLQIVAQRNLP